MYISFSYYLVILFSLLSIIISEGGTQRMNEMKERQWAKGSSTDWTVPFLLYLISLSLMLIFYLFRDLLMPYSLFYCCIIICFYLVPLFILFSFIIVLYFPLFTPLFYSLYFVLSFHLSWPYRIFVLFISLNFGTPLFLLFSL